MSLFDINLEMEKIKEDQKKEINDIKSLIDKKNKFQNKFFSNSEEEKLINDIRQTNCSKKKGFGNILNDTLKLGSIGAGIGVNYGVKGAIKISLKEISKEFFNYGIPILGHIICGAIFGGINWKSLNKKIDIIIEEIDSSLKTEEKEEIIKNELIKTFNLLSDNYLKQ